MQFAKRGLGLYCITVRNENAIFVYDCSRETGSHWPDLFRSCSVQL